MYHSFLPGQVWLDTKGERIQAHGGSLLYEDGVFYWYGENKAKTDGRSKIWHWGVGCYASEDLYNWENLGLILPPSLDDPASPLYPEAMMDRPHILHNPRTGQYVCWMKVMAPSGGQTMSVFTAERLTGPYSLVRTGYHPLGMDAGDFDLVTGADGRGYICFERVHSELICADLTEDFTAVTGHYTAHFPRSGPPYVREAPAHFTRNGKHYLLTSGTTGYLPNPSEAAVGDDVHGPFLSLGNPHPGDPTRTSFHSQISSVFQVPGKQDLYIALADRWAPRQTDLDYGFYGKLFEAVYSGSLAAFRREQAEKGIDVDAFRRANRDTARDTSIADYVWLPLQFDPPDPDRPAGRVRIEWTDEWRWEDWS